MKKVVNNLEGIYAWITFIALMIGFVVAILFIVSFIIGGTTGGALAVFAGEVMNWAIKLATIAILLGLIYIYLSKKHTLTMTDSEKQKKIAG